MLTSFIELSVEVLVVLRPDLAGPIAILLETRLVGALQDIYAHAKSRWASV